MDGFSILTGLLGYLDNTQEVELKSFHAQTMSFLLLNLHSIPPFYEVNSFNRKWLAHGVISEIFFLDHFSPSFLGQKY
jgi:hypothetical protein